MSKTTIRWNTIPLFILLVAIMGTFTIFRENRVVGEVFDSESRLPLAGCEVSLGDGRILYTDEGGRFSFGTPREVIALELHAPNYHPQKASCDASRFAWGDLQCRFVLQPKLLTVSLIDALDGTLEIAGASVWANDTPLSQVGKNKYAGIRLDPPLEIHVQAPGYHPVDVHLGQSSRYSGDHSLFIDLHPLILRGQVLASDNGQPIPDAHILAGDTKTQSDLQGLFELVRILPETSLHIQREGFHEKKMDSIDTALLIGELSHQVELDPIYVPGLVIDRDSGAPLIGALVTAGDQTLQTDRHGVFELRALIEGTEITVGSRLHHPESTVYVGESSLEFPLRPIKVDLVVLDQLTRQPIPDATVKLNDDSEEWKTDETGTLTLPGAREDDRVSLVNLLNHSDAHITLSGDERQVITLTPHTVRLRVMDGTSREPILWSRLELDGQRVNLHPDGSLDIDPWGEEHSLYFRAAGYRSHTLSLNADSLGAVLDPDQPRFVTAEASTGTQPALDLLVPRFEARGIYVPFGALARPDKMQALLDLVKDTELNTIIVDMKGDRGYLGYRSQLPLATSFGVNRRDLMDVKELLEQCQRAGIYTVARLVVFKDHPLANAKPEWAVVHEDGTLWLDREGLGWANPFLQEVRDYNIAIATEVAQLGFNEIQFDYIRFPSDGDVGSIVYQQENTAATRSAAIELFARQVTEALAPYDVFTSVDVFGLTIWVTPQSDMGIGQRVMDIAPHMDYLCPMIYPSTFGPGNLGYDNPSLYPYEVISRSVTQAESRVPPSMKVRPWLQAYWYTLDEYKLQKQAATDAQAWGWSFWNAGGNYPSELFDPIP